MTSEPYRLTPIGAEAAAQLVDSVSKQNVIDQYIAGLRREERTEQEPFAWLLAHCTDGVTWGAASQGGAVVTAAGVRVDPPIPAPALANVQELRIFGPDAELLVWRTGDPAAPFLGRRLEAGRPEPGAELRSRVLPLLGRATEELEHHGRRWTLLADGAGRRQIVPLSGLPQGIECPAVVDTIEYTDTDTDGVVRVANRQVVRLRPRRAKELEAAT